MRKLKLQVQMTVDGYMAGPNGEMDWISFDWDDGLKEYVTELTESMDCIVLGRNLAEGFIPHWAAVAQNPAHPEHSAGKIFSDTPKVVFSTTLEQSKWDNTVLAKGNLVEEITRLKQQQGKGIIAYGGREIVSSLISNGLVDEFNLFVNPVALGKGMAIFQGLEQTQPLVLETARPFPCGIVLVRYRRAA
ncbi:MAG: dihydrofolate reductase family protein [Anaerolineae bacterium]